MRVPCSGMLEFTVGGAPLVSIVQIILLIETSADSYEIILKKEKEVGR
jgi:hypothetical protein